MRNHTLLRLAGFGFFGVSFLSTGLTDKTAWNIVQARSSRLLPDLSFTEPAFGQELSFPAKPKTNKPVTPPGAAVLPGQALSAPAIDKQLIDTPANPVKKIRPEIIKKSKPENDEISEPDVPESSDILIYTPHQVKPGENLRHMTGPATSDMNEDEKIFPPADYVDEVRKPAREKQFRTLVPIITTSAENGAEEYPASLLQRRIDHLYNFATDWGYSGRYAFLINLGLKSGKKRFLIIDLENRSVIDGGLVAHGRGREKFTLNKKYSNKNGSACSSLGFYKVGGSYNGGFGKSFRLIGLEKTNSNALSRAIVLHSMGCIPDEEINYPICQSEGCPSVSPAFLDEISRIIKLADKPVLLWVFDPAIDKDFSP